MLPRSVKRNIEIKAFYPRLQSGHQVARDIAAVLHGMERQRDIYFRVASGRLKLRQRWPGAAPPHLQWNGPDAKTEPQPIQLIWYHRTDEARPRASDYSLIEVPEGERLRDVLAGALGVAAEVVKLRTIYLHDNVRIHLDEVAGLGNFLEFEAIVDATCDSATAQAKLHRLQKAFGILSEHVESQSYGELILRDGPILQIQNA